MGTLHSTLDVSILGVVPETERYIFILQITRLYDSMFRMASQLSFSQFTPVAISPHNPLQSTPFEDVVSTSSNSSGSSPGGSSPNSSSNESSKDESG